MEEHRGARRSKKDPGGPRSSQEEQRDQELRARLTQFLRKLFVFGAHLRAKCLVHGERLEA